MRVALLIDSADAEKYKDLSAWLPIDGVTTNPSILASNQNVSAEEQIKKLDQILNDKQTLHVQVVSENAEAMVVEGKRIYSAFDREVIIKVPVSKEGFKAIKSFYEKGIRTTATGIFTIQQAFLASKAGASFVAPYVNRIDDQHGDSREVLERIMHLFHLYQMPTRVIAASFKNVRQAEEAMLAGVHELTIAPDIFEKLIMHQGTTDSIKQFTQHFEGAFGQDKVMFN
ncbi:fructose-6-phosphate aldolase 2 [Geomicrobium halophilum]|uniref:Fructose-6-phosphate aldolase 2 n=1 Tax=Geomicrobium halophilum TaxID=549000 RepID=A0A841PQH5_9BACL|nr:transaldolase family protein [Geomicrobium halophilum]MBB6451117.1 fructose-6-phosphate aldolase 2 [Geomicrobium halophilum]